MKSLAVRLSLLTVVLFCVAFVTPEATRAQESRPAPESPPSESPRPEPPSSPPAESPRNDPPPSPPAESPRNDPPPSPPAESPRNNPPPNPPSEAPRSDSAPGGRRNNDGGSSRGNNDNRRNDNNARPTNEGGSRPRGTMDGDGSGNRRDRIIETESGEIVAPPRTRAENPGAGRPRGGNPGGNPTTGGGNRNGNPGGGRHGDRDRNGDRERGRNGDGDRRDRHRDGRGHRHYRGDECYQVPTYNDTVTYSAASYPDYDQDDSRSAYERGYNDGLYTGANDGRRGQTFDPYRSHFYQRGTGGYRSSKGNQADYQMAYRDGFMAGYREGYQNWRTYFVGGEFRRF